MFGSNPFGQSSSSPFGSQPAFGQSFSSPFGSQPASSSPFGSQPAFGQTTNGSNNPFAPKPVGITSPFGSQTGGSIFGGMSTSLFGAQSSSPLGSTSVFGASSSPAFGFGSSTPAFGGSGIFEQQPSCGGFGSNTTQSPFGSSFQQTQPAFSSNLFGSSTPFGAPSQPVFGSSSSPAFGSSSTPGFGATSTPAFDSTASPTLGNTSGGFGVSTSPFGSSTPAFGTSSTPEFGSTTTPAFGASTAPAFGASTTSAFSASSGTFNFVFSPKFGQSAAVFGSTPFGTSSLGVQNASLGAQTTASTFGGSGFGQSAFGGKRGGSRIAPYSSTPETDGDTCTQPTSKIESISAMPIYKDKSHEELRWEDYQLGDKGGPAPAGQSTTAHGFGPSSFGLASTPAFAQSSATPFSSTTPSNPFAPKTTGVFGGSGFGSSPSSSFGSSPFAMSNTSNPFGSTTSATFSLFGSTAQTFRVGTSPSIFGNSSTSAFGTPSIFGPTSSQGTSSAFNTGLVFSNTQSSPLFQSNMSTLTPESSPFAQTSSFFGQTAPWFSQTNLFSAPSTGFGGNTFSSNPSLLSNSNPLEFDQTTALDLGRGANSIGCMVEEIWQELATAKYLTWEHESTERYWKLQNLREACVAALKQKQFLDASDAEDFVDEISKSNLDQLEALGSIFDKAAEDDTPTEVPDYLCCKITLDIFRDPVITPCGITYERAVILDHLLKVGNFDPITREPLYASQLVPNMAIKEAVRAYLEKHGWAYKTD